MRVLAAAVNPADGKVLAWKDGGSFLHAKVTPLVVGYDFAGKVEKVGEGVSGRAVGEAVFGFLPYARSTKLGSFAEFVVVKDATIAKRPGSLSPESAAALATGGCTALQALRDSAKVKPGQKVLVNGASGGVGLQAVQIAKALGAEVWGTCSAAKMSMVKAAGADHIVDYRATPLAKIDGKFDVVFDVASNSSYHECAALLGNGGTYLTLLPGLSLVTGFVRSLLSSHRVRTLVVAPVASDLAWLAEHAVSGGVSPRIEAAFPFVETKAALKRFAEGTAMGKIVVTMG